MDKNAIKKYAIWARRELIARVSQRAALYEITAEGFGDADAVSVHGRILSQEEKNQRRALIEKIKEKGYEQVMEEVAYTWFNRFSALRFMEVNGYLPSHVRVFTDDENNFKPQIITEAINLEMDGLDMQKIYEFKTANDDDGLFKYLIISQCNALSDILPGMFQHISDYTELLFPDNLLRKGSVVEQMISMIPEEDWTDQVQIIGWLYQYYIAEPKDDRINTRKQYHDADIPFVTQLFTPDWIVHFMVENSLGRLWIEGHPNSKLRLKCKYYLTECKINEKLLPESVRLKYSHLKPEELRCIDPCMGSGHILCVLFDTLIQIYGECGYTLNEAVISIVKFNLWGLDIDERAAQLSYFTVMMKARQYDRRFFLRKIQPHVHVIQESNGIRLSLIRNMECPLSECERNNAIEQINRLVSEMLDANIFGSLIEITSCNWDLLRSFAKPNKQVTQLQLDNDEIVTVCNRLQDIINVGESLSQKYHVVVVNPPYMSNKYMPNGLKDYVANYYAELRSDLFSAFVKRCHKMCFDFGQMGFLTPYVWMFIKTYESMRRFVFSKMTISSLVQLEYNAFESACVPVAAFSLRNYLVNMPFDGIKLSDFRGSENQEPKALEAINSNNCNYRFTAIQNNFAKIPGEPVAYWVSQAMFNTFAFPSIQTVCSQKTRISTGDNERFMRKWFEIDFSKMMYPNKWIPCPKGGDFRKWYGNIDIVLNWENDGEELKNFPRAMLGDSNYFMKPGLTWTVISSTKTGFRIVPKGCICDHKGPLIYINDFNNEKKLLGLLNSRYSEELLNVTAPTIGFEWGAIAKTPWIGNTPFDQIINTLVEKCIEISKEDWDSFETSWEFRYHPLIPMGFVENKRNENSSHTEVRQGFISRLANCFVFWKQQSDKRFNILKKNEEELNRIFLNIFGLQDEFKPDVEDKDVTVRKSDLQRDIQSLVSYAVGCMFGRYSLDKPGIVFAGGEWEFNFLKFHVDEDAIIPICDDEYFNDDIVSRFVKFIEVVYGKETLEENLKFIADALGGSGTSREIIRNYFINGFYANHLKVYQKRPIYWLFDSGKKNGFKCLVYMHRYKPDTIARIRTDYVHEQQSRYRTAIADLQSRIDNAASTSERVKLSKKLKTVQEQDEELRIYEEKIHHLADQMIKIDLDDGVKVNYAKFQDVLAKIK